MLLQSLAGQGSQTAAFPEAARPGFLIVQSLHDLGCDGVLLFPRERLHAPQCLFQRPVMFPKMAQNVLCTLGRGGAIRRADQRLSKNR